MKRLLISLLLFITVLSLASCTKEADYQKVLSHFENVGEREDNEGMSQYGRYYYEYTLREDEKVETEIKVYENKYIEIISEVSGEYNIKYTLGFYYNNAGSYKANISVFILKYISGNFYGGSYKYTTDNLDATHTYSYCDVSSWEYNGDNELATDEKIAVTNNKVNEAIKNGILDAYLYFSNNGLQYV